MLMGSRKMTSKPLKVPATEKRFSQLKAATSRVFRRE
jgi:hypothetical protein